MFSRLRMLNKPVELYVVPDVDNAFHALQNPAQTLASRAGTVDWMDFWLNGHEDADSAKAEQYKRWRRLRAERERERESGALDFLSGPSRGLK